MSPFELQVKIGLIRQIREFGVGKSAVGVAIFGAALVAAFGFQSSL